MRISRTESSQDPATFLHHLSTHMTYVGFEVGIVTHNDAKVSEVILHLNDIFKCWGEIIGVKLQTFIWTIAKHFKFVAIEEHFIFILPIVYNVQIFL